jgi:hypothetical protein
MLAQLVRNQSSSNQIITITTMCHISLSFPNPFEIISNQFKLVLTLLAENWRTNLDNTEQENTNYKEKDFGKTKKEDSINYELLEQIKNGRTLAQNLIAKN